MESVLMVCFAEVPAASFDRALDELTRLRDQDDPVLPCWYSLCFSFFYSINDFCF